MFDTNTLSDIVRGDEIVLQHVERLDPRQCCVSAVTAGEVAYGLARRPDATRLHRLTQAVMDRLEVLPWDAETARRYGRLRASQERLGLSLGARDTMIAAHALTRGLTLISSNPAFSAVRGLAVQNCRDA